MTLLKALASEKAVAVSPFSVTNEWVGHWSLLLDGDQTTRGPRIHNPTKEWAGSNVTRIDAPSRTSWIFGDLYGPQKARLQAKILEDSRGLPFDGELINGHCVILSFNRRSDEPSTFTVWTNRFGSMHIYLVRGLSKTLLTTSYLEAAKYSAGEIDWDSISRFARQGFFPGDRTHFEDVRVLGPHRRYEWDQSGHLLEDEPYWSWPESPDFNGSYPEALDELSFLLQTVCTELSSEGTLAVPISGGLDSRTTLAALPDTTWQSGKALGFSYGYDDESVELRIARQLARCRRIPFEGYVIGPYLLKHRRHLIEATGGLQDISQPRQEAVLERLSQRCNRVLAAHWGDVLLDSQLPISSGSSSLEEIAAKKLHKPGADELLECIDFEGQGCRRLTQEVMAQQVAAEIGAYEAIKVDDLKLKAWKTDTWSHRWTLSSLRVYQTYLFPKLVFYDTRVTDFLTSLPAEFLEGRRLQIDLIKHRAPDLARVRWEEYDANLYLAPYNDSLMVPARAFRKLKRMRKKKKETIRNWEVQLRGESNLAQLEAILTDPHSAIYNITDPARVRSLIDGLNQEPTREIGYAASQLLTLASVFEEVGL